MRVKLIEIYTNICIVFTNTYKNNVNTSFNLGKFDYHEKICMNLVISIHHCLLVSFV